MGHLGHLKEEYHELVQRLEAGQVSYPEPKDARAWQAWKEILEILYTPEEAELASRMPVLPASIEGLEARFGRPRQALLPRLEAMCDKGLVMDIVHPETGEVKYVLSPPVIGFFEFSMMRAQDGLPKKRLAEAYEAYAHGDPAFTREVFGRQTTLGRAVVHETTLPEEVLPDVLDWERATALIEGARALAVSLCYCRHKAEHLGTRCEAPMENCLSLNGGAEFIIRRRFGRALERSQALEILAEARGRGLVQIADNVQNRPTFICNCCGCCCGQLKSITDFDLPGVKPSGFVPACDVAHCKGCGRCARACPILAISMTARQAEPGHRNLLQPAVDTAKCIGCGVCADACKTQALRMARRQERPAVPVNTIERVVRMALERGRLAHLVDRHAGRGSRFLSQVLGVLAAFPPVQKALASEQLRSRFVRAAMERIQDPTGG